MSSKLSNTNEELTVDKCEHNCGRYVHNKKTVCCNKCNGLSNAHSAICNKENKHSELDICIKLKNERLEDFQLIDLHVVSITDIPLRMLQRLKALITKGFPKDVCLTHVGSEDDDKLKDSNKLHDGNLIYLRGEVVNFRKRLVNLIINFHKLNPTPNTVFKILKEHVLTDKDHTIVELNAGLDLQLYYMWCLEDIPTKYKVVYYD